MCANQFSPALSQVLVSEARCDLFAVLVERRGEWLTAAAEWCDQAGVSRSDFHRDHKSPFLGFDLVDLRDGGSDASTHPTSTTRWRPNSKTPVPSSPPPSRDSSDSSVGHRAESYSVGIYTTRMYQVALTNRPYSVDSTGNSA
ncbi:hypothetical protein [Haladaptatus sp. T7]|uniref:hypothetical protein n=1 Tax=Haladaptatus sp. T7 TaxID=2029368 RepID=UPI0021A257AA|nr:hypothetical protein [Haladaptatus sp. T7]GKZ13939.1 hypothetical protein HAL_18200 [Haladaptatus sp. T7]